MYTMTTATVNMVNNDDRAFVNVVPYSSKHPSDTYTFTGHGPELQFGLSNIDSIQSTNNDVSDDMCIIGDKISNSKSTKVRAIDGTPLRQTSGEMNNGITMMCSSRDLSVKDYVKAIDKDCSTNNSREIVRISDGLQKNSCKVGCRILAGSGCATSKREGSSEGESSYLTTNEQDYTELVSNKDSSVHSYISYKLDDNCATSVDARKQSVIDNHPTNTSQLQASFNLPNTEESNTMTLDNCISMSPSNTPRSIAINRPIQNSNSPTISRSCAEENTLISSRSTAALPITDLGTNVPCNGESFVINIKSESSRNNNVIASQGISKINSMFESTPRIKPPVPRKPLQLASGFRGGGDISNTSDSSSGVLLAENSTCIDNTSKPAGESVTSYSEKSFNYNDGANKVYQIKGMEERQYCGEGECASLPTASTTMNDAVLVCSREDNELQFVESGSPCERYFSDEEPIHSLGSSPNSDSLVSESMDCMPVLTDGAGNYRESTDRVNYSNPAADYKPDARSNDCSQCTTTEPNDSYACEILQGSNSSTKRANVAYGDDSGCDGESGDCACTTENLLLAPDAASDSASTASTVKCVKESDAGNVSGKDGNSSDVDDNTSDSENYRSCVEDISSKEIETSINEVATVARSTDSMSFDERLKDGSPVSSSVMSSSVGFTYSMDVTKADRSRINSEKKASYETKAIALLIEKISNQESLNRKSCERINSEDCTDYMKHGIHADANMGSVHANNCRESELLEEELHTRVSANSTKSNSQLEKYFIHDESKDQSSFCYSHDSTVKYSQSIEDFDPTEESRGKLERISIQDGGDSYKGARQTEVDIADESEKIEPNKRMLEDPIKSEILSVKFINENKIADDIINETKDKKKPIQLNGNKYEHDASTDEDEQPKPNKITESPNKFQIKQELVQSTESIDDSASNGELEKDYCIIEKPPRRASMESTPYVGSSVRRSYLEEVVNRLRGSRQESFMSSMTSVCSSQSTWYVGE